MVLNQYVHYIFWDFVGLTKFGEQTELQLNEKQNVNAA